MRLARFPIVCGAGCVFILLTAQVPGQSPSLPLSAPYLRVREAVAQYNEKNWEGAVEGYGKVVKDNPYSGVRWREFGYALHQIGRYDESIAAFERALALGETPTTCMYNIACGQALSGRPEPALDWLARAMDAGFTAEDTLRNDHDLDSLRELTRFREIVGMFPPPGMTREAGWKYDLDFLARRMEQVHYNLFAKISRAEFEQAILDLKDKVAVWDDAAMRVGIQRLAARVGDGHTAVWQGSHGPSAAREPAFPVRFYWFSDGLFVVGASGAGESILGSKVLQVGRMSAEAALESMRSACSVDNAMGFKSQAPRLLSRPAYLAALGIIEDRGKLPLMVESRNGDRMGVTLEAEENVPPDSLTMARERSEFPLPAYLKNTGEYHWFEHWPARRMIYAQINAIQDEPDESMAEFVEKLFAAIEAQGADRLVLDLRLNSGGNNYLNRPLVHALIRCPAINQKGHLFVLIGRQTFSAAMNLATDLERHVEAIFVGEPTGSSPNFVGESTRITLPCTGTMLSCSSLYWQRSTATDQRVWIPPGIVAELSSRDYLNNRDPAMDAIYDYLAAADSP